MPSMQTPQLPHIWTAFPINAVCFLFPFPSPPRCLILWRTYMLDRDFGLVSACDCQKVWKALVWKNGALFLFSTVKEFSRLPVSNAQCTKQERTHRGRQPPLWRSCLFTVGEPKEADLLTLLIWFSGRTMMLCCDSSAAAVTHFGN